jgi:hypothetical protein
MKSAILIVGVTFLVGIVVGVLGFVSAKRQTLEVRELFTSFTYFLEDHEGRFPASEDELRKAAFVEVQPDGAILLINREGDRFQRAATGYPLRKLERFKIPWGVDLSKLTIEPDGITRAADRQEVLIIGQGASIDILRQFTRDLIKVAEVIRGAGEVAKTANDE